jgi:hypothetical protein
MNNMRLFATAIFLGSAGTLAGTSAGIANAADSVVTELVTDRCTVTVVETEDEAGEPLKKEDHFPTAWRCKGNGGLFVYVLYNHQREAIAFGTARRETTSYMRHGHFGSWGPSVEWRGKKDKSGQLVPAAVIAPYRWDIRNGDDEKDRDVGGDLAIIRLGKSKSETCVVAWVDTVANPDAMDIARKAADERAAGHICSPSRKSIYLGKRSPGR